MFRTTRTLCEIKSGRNLRVRKAYNVHNNFRDINWHEYDGRKGIYCLEQLGHL